MDYYDKRRQEFEQFLRDMDAIVAKILEVERRHLADVRETREILTRILAMNADAPPE